MIYLIPTQPPQCVPTLEATSIKQFIKRCWEKSRFWGEDLVPCSNHYYGMPLNKGTQHDVELAQNFFAATPTNEAGCVHIYVPE